MMKEFLRFTIDGELLEQVEPVDASKFCAEALEQTLRDAADWDQVPAHDLVVVFGWTPAPPLPALKRIPGKD